MDKLIKKYKPTIKEKFSTNDGAGWPFIQQLIIAPMSLITTVLLAHILSIKDYGYYRYVVSMYYVIAIFGFSGIYGITSLNMQKGEDNFFYLGFKYKKILRWIPSFISILVSAYYFYTGNNFFGILFLMTIFSHLFVDTYDFYLSATAGRGEFKLNAILGIVYYFFAYFPPIVTAYFTHNLYLVFATMFIFQFLVRLISFNYVTSRFNLKNFDDLESDDNKIKEFKKESASFSFTAALNTFGSNSSSIVVFNRLGAYDNAVYSLALTFADFFGGIMSAPLNRATLLLSKMTKNKSSEKEKVEYTKSLTKKTFVFSLFGMILFMIILPFVYKYLFAKYFFSYKYALIYSISILATTFTPAYLFFYEKRNIKLINIIQIISLCVNLILLFIVSMKYGLWGAVIISMIMKFIPNLIMTIMLPYKNN